MNFKTLRPLAISLLIGSGVIHLVIIPQGLIDHPTIQYINALFVLHFIGTVIAAFGMRRRDMYWGWLLGVFLSTGSIAAYAVSRTVGLPGTGIDPWFVPIGILSLLFEGGFIYLTFLAWPHLDPFKFSERKLPFSFEIHRKAVIHEGTYIEMDETKPTMKVNYLLPTAALVATAIFGVGLYLKLATPVYITQDMLEEKYGVRVVHIAPTMMGSIIDVRLQVVDEQKAKNIYYDHWILPSLILPEYDNLRILPPHIHSHKIVAGKMIFIFYPNVQNLVQSGSEVSVLFGNQEVTALTVK